MNPKKLPSKNSRTSNLTKRESKESVASDIVNLILNNKRKLAEKNIALDLPKIQMPRVMTNSNTLYLKSDRGRVDLKSSRVLNSTELYKVSKFPAKINKTPRDTFTSIKDGIGSQMSSVTRSPR